MPTDTIPDKFEKLGAPNDTADILSSTPVGSAVVPPPDARLTYYPMGGGVPAGGGGGGGGDPDFARVVLLLRGDSVVDLSSYAHVASKGAGVTFTTANPVAGVVTSWLNMAGAGDCHWSYLSAPEFALPTIWTIDVQLRFNVQPANWVGLAASPGLGYFMQYTGGSGTATIAQQGSYGAMPSSGPVSLNAAHYLRLVSDGVNVSRYIDGARDATNGISQSAGAATAYELLDGTAASPNMRVAEVRVTYGKARNNPTDLTIPMQTAPWPNN